MNPVKPEELSALVDQELNEERAREVRARLAADSSFAAELDALMRVDRQARAAATTAAFEPAIRWPAGRPSNRPLAGLVSIVAALLLVRIMSKVIDVAMVAWGLNAAALVVVLAASYWLVRQEERGDEMRARR